MAGMTSRAVDLLLRGTAGRMRAHVERQEPPAGASPLVVLLDATGDTCRPERCLRAGVAVLTPHAPIWEDAVEAMEWAAEHAGELGADPRRLIVAGEGGGGALGAERPGPRPAGSRGRCSFVPSSPRRISMPHRPVSRRPRSSSAATRAVTSASCAARASRSGA